MMIRKIFTLSLLAVAGMLMSYTSARAQMFGGSFSVQAVLDDGKVDLSWEQPENFNAVYYLVYRAQMSLADSNVNIGLSFNLIDSTTATEYQDTTTPPPSTLYTYYVKAVDASGEVRISSFARVYVNFGDYGRDKVTITSTPPVNATVGSLYQYQVQAVSSDSTAVLTYHLGDHPPLMAMDSTGLISWIPQHMGWYEIEVLVTSNKGGRARQEYAIRVAGINGTIAGTVTDSSNHPISGVLVRLYQRDMDWHFDYHTTTDSNGYYAIHGVDAGRYLVRATPLNPNYLPQWYNGASGMANATPVVVSDTTPVVTNFMLENRFHVLPKFTVTGVVTDDSTGALLKGALVVFAKAEFTFNSARNNQDGWEQGDNYRDLFQNMYQQRNANRDFRLDGSSPYVFKTYTDSNGVYTDTLPQGFYVAFAKAIGYHRVFFNNEVDFLSADVITLSSDTANINFALTPLPPVVLGQISGAVLDSTTGSGVSARIIAFRDVWNYPDTLKMHVAGAYFADADSTGSYTLEDLPPGYYKILAIPLGGYAPSFYSLTGPTVRWKDASTVAVDGNATSGVDIYVMPLSDSTSGYTSINGSVGSTTSGSNSRVNRVSSTIAVSGALVYASDGSGNIVGYGVTDGSGSYTISGIAPGTYTVSTDVVGYSSSGTTTASPTYDSNGNPVPYTSDLAVSPETPTAVQEKPVQPTNYSLDQNYPNPFNPTTQIAFSIPQDEHVTIAIFNILGQQVATLMDGNLNAGAHVVTWNARNQSGEMLPTGVYFYRLSTSNFTAVKKMLLLK